MKQAVWKIVKWLEGIFLSDKAKESAERVVIYLAIISFLVHLGVIFLVRIGAIYLNAEDELLKSYISAVYTPFSFILIYEVYLLVYYLPKSITSYIGKQYEIVTLIIIRRIFKDMPNLELTTTWFSNEGDKQFTLDVVATLLLFFFIYLFNRLIIAQKNNQVRSWQQRKQGNPPGDNRRVWQKLTPKQKEERRLKKEKRVKHTEVSRLRLQRFIRTKTAFSAVLAPVLAALSIYSLGHWIYVELFNSHGAVHLSPDINKIFYDNFFTLLILTDVLLLLISLIHTDDFRKVIRNSGFVISTIMIKLSFTTTGLVNIGLTVSAVVFGVLILYIHNLFENLSKKRQATEQQSTKPGQPDNQPAQT